MKKCNPNLVQCHVIQGKDRRSFASLSEAVASFRFRLLVRRAAALADAEIVDAVKIAFLLA